MTFLKEKSYLHFTEVVQLHGRTEVQKHVGQVGTLVGQLVEYSVGDNLDGKLNVPQRRGKTVAENDLDWFYLTIFIFLWGQWLCNWLDVRASGLHSYAFPVTLLPDKVEEWVVALHVEAGDFGPQRDVRPQPRVVGDLSPLFADGGQVADLSVRKIGENVEQHLVGHFGDVLCGQRVD